MIRLSGQQDWAFRAEAWDREQQRVGDAARFAEIEAINKKAVRVGRAMLDAVEARIPKAASSLNRSPHALAAWAEVGAKLSREGVEGLAATAIAEDPAKAAQQEMRAVLAQLTPGEVLQAREVSLMLTQAKARMLNGFPPPAPAIERGRS
jgi:hypothetical protein